VEVKIFFVIRILFMSTYVTFVLSLVEMVCVTARLAPSLPKPERPQRQGVRRESVENSLAAAAAKLSNMPVSCRVNTVVLIQFYVNSMHYTHHLRAAMTVLEVGKNWEFLRLSEHLVVHFLAISIDKVKKWSESISPASGDSIDFGVCSS